MSPDGADARRCWSRVAGFGRRPSAGLRRNEGKGRRGGGEEEAGAEEHRAAVGGGEGRRVGEGPRSEAGGQREHGDGEQACDARHRVVDAARDSGVPFVDRAERGGGQGSDGQRQAEAQERTPGSTSRT